MGGLHIQADVECKGAVQVKGCDEGVKILLNALCLCDDRVLIPLECLQCQRLLKLDVIEAKQIISYKIVW